MNTVLTFIIWFLAGWIASSLILTAWWAWLGRRQAVWEQHYNDVMGILTPRQRQAEIAQMNQWWGSRWTN